MKTGMIRMRDAIAIVEPMRVSFRALCPCPSRRSSCPGRTERAVSSDGAPRNIDGMKSRKVWVIAIDIMKIRSGVGWRFWIRVMDRIAIAIRFMWIPGIRPVRVPVSIPRTNGRMRFNIKDRGLICY